MKVAIDLNHKRIQVQHDKLVVPPDEMDGRSMYLELALLWERSPWLQEAPFGYDGAIVMAGDWELRHVDVYGDIVGILL